MLTILAVVSIRKGSALIQYGRELRRAAGLLHDAWSQLIRYRMTVQLGGCVIHQHILKVQGLFICGDVNQRCIGIDL